MAQKLTEIYQQLIAAKESKTELAALDTQAGENMQYFIDELSNSKVSIWRLWCWVVAFYLWIFQKQDDTFRLEFEQLAAEKQVGTLGWYRNNTLNYLFGKAIIWSANDKFQQELLPTDDENLLKIVKYCATAKSPDKIKVKVATDNGGVPGTLTMVQALAVSTFLNNIRVAGDEIELVNNTADKLNIELDVYVDPLLIDLNTGELIITPGTNPTEDAIDNFLLNLEFNGRFKRTKFVDAIQEALGVTDVDVNVLQAKYGTFAYVDIDVSVIPDAGYFEIENLTINYKAAEV